MSTPLNLTLTRGPSVWDQQTVSQSHWRVYGVAIGAALVAVAMHPRVNRQRLVGLALGVAGICAFAGRVTSTREAGARLFGVLFGTRKDNAVDRASEDSFPASDPPQYM